MLFQKLQPQNLQVILIRRNGRSDPKFEIEFVMAVTAVVLIVLFA